MIGNIRIRSGLKSQRGFTLIEIMVVVIIIGILAAMVVPKVVNRLDDAQIAKVKADLGTLEAAIELYRMDNFAYPRSEQGLDVLVNRPVDSSIRNWKNGGYIKRLPKDPWGNDYLYLYPGQHGEFDLFSYGRDGRPGGEEIDTDIGNWNLE